MAKESSFDIVSEIALNEVDNALNQARHEAATRYDLKSTDCVIDFDKAKSSLTFSAVNDLALKNLLDVIQTKLIKRGVDIKALHLDKPESAGGGRMRQTGTLVQGISSEIGREINKRIKQSGLKVGVQIQGDSVRVSGKSKDTLQEAIVLIKAADFGIPIQFANFR